MTKTATRNEKNSLKIVVTPWPAEKLCDIATFAHGSTPSKARREYWKGILPWASPKDFKGDRLTDARDHISEIAVAAGDAVIAEPGSLLVVVRSGILKRRLPVAIVDVRLAFNQDVKCIRPNIDIVLTEFLALVLRAAEASIVREGVKVGPTVHSIRSGYLENLEIPLPPLAEQHLIATRLKKQMAAVELARAASQTRLAAAKALPAAYIREVFESAEASKWETVPVAEVCRVVEGQVDPREKEFGVLPHVNGENIESGTGRMLKVQSAAEDKLVSGKYLFEQGMVLYSKLRPYLRKVAIAPFRGVCSADMYPLTFDHERVDSRFAMWSLLAGPFSRYAVKESERARMPKLNREQLYAWDMPLPSLDCQRRIADDLSRQLAESECMTDISRQELAAIEALPAQLLREAFTGDIQPKGD